MIEQSFKFKLWKWTLLGALYGALPLPTLLLVGDVVGALDGGGTISAIRDGALRESRNLFVILFFAATLPAYLVGRVYERKSKREQAQSKKRRSNVVILGATIAAAPMIFLASLYSIFIENFLWQNPSPEESIKSAAFLIAMFCAPIAILGAFATCLLVYNEKSFWE